MKLSLKDNACYETKINLKKKNVNFFSVEVFSYEFGFIFFFTYIWNV